MIRKPLIAHDRGVPTGFRLRGEDVSRLEGFSDAVFGFALTLLVVSLEVPKTYAELMGAMRGFVAFALCFGLLSQVWLNHYRFFRRYGLEDSHTACLNLVLLFVVLFYTYPLKFLFTLIVAAWFHIRPAGDGRAMITNAQMPHSSVQSGWFCLCADCSFPLSLFCNFRTPSPYSRRASRKAFN